MASLVNGSLGISSFYIGVINKPKILFPYCEKNVGLIFYDHGTIVLDLRKITSGSQFMSGTLDAMSAVSPDGSEPTGSVIMGGPYTNGNPNSKFIPDFLVSGSIDDIVDHSYQDLKDPSDRCYHAIERNLNLLENFDLVHEFIKNNQSRFEHNLNLLKNSVFQKTVDQVKIQGI